ncbi:MAG: RdgB/HAM1 family non-canonical purine NTP pyrophosphatase [Caldisericia bacterium]
MKKKFLKTLFIATENTGKLREFKEILKSLNIDINIVSVKDLNNYKPPDEIGKTFYENALLKAKHAFDFTKIPTIADDSGLEVEYLNGLPGVLSKRFYNDSGNFEKNIEKLLNLLKDVPFEKRKARFKCVLVYKDDFYEKSFEGVLDGFIWFNKRGKGGFGYDPIFYLPEYDKTVGELKSKEKNKISHRYKSILKFVEFLKTNFSF